MVTLRSVKGPPPARHRARAIPSRPIVGTNTTYLSNAVNDFFGCNLKTLINWCRVQHAKEMLALRTCRLKDIPFASGFSSKSTFYVAFKLCEGMTPNQYAASRRTIPSDE